MSSAMSPAAAAGGEQGKLLIKGPGSVYAGQISNAADPPIITRSVAAGSAAAYSFRVKNTGTSVAQYNIQIPCDSACDNSTVAVSAGALAITPLTQGPSGYFTAPINPGAVATYTLKVTPSKSGTTPGDRFDVGVALFDTSGDTLLSTATTWTYITRTSGTGDSDQFVSSSGVGVTSGDDSAVASPTVNVGQTATWKVKITNNTAAAQVVKYTLERASADCADDYTLTVKDGTTNVTSFALGAGYFKGLSQGQSMTLTVSAKVLQSPRSCVEAQSRSLDYWDSTAQSDTANTTRLVLNVPAE